MWPRLTTSCCILPSLVSKTPRYPNPSARPAGTRLLPQGSTGHKGMTQRPPAGSGVVATTGTDLLAAVAPVGRHDTGGTKHGLFRLHVPTSSLTWPRFSQGIPLWTKSNHRPAQVQIGGGDPHASPGFTAAADGSVGVSQEEEGPPRGSGSSPPLGTTKGGYAKPPFGP